MSQNTRISFSLIFTFLLAGFFLSACDINNILSSTGSLEKKDDSAPTLETTQDPEAIPSEFGDALPETNPQPASEAQTAEAQNDTPPESDPSPDSKLNEQSLTEKEDFSSQEVRKYQWGSQNYNKSAFDQAIKNKETVLVDVYAKWCSICQANGPYLTAAIEQLKGMGEKVVVFRVNYDEDREFLKTYDIPIQSSYVVFKDGQEVKRVHGLLSQETFVELISSSDQKANVLKNTEQQDPI